MTITMAAPKRRAVRLTKRTGDSWTAGYMLLPALLTLALVAGYPIVAALRLSFVEVADQINPQTGMLEKTESPILGVYLGDLAEVRP